MICRLCLKEANVIINIFDEAGVTLKISEILRKHFWFEPKSDDPLSTAVCNDCWTKVNDFHEFYLAIKETHDLLTERYFTKNYPTVEEQTTKRNTPEITYDHRNASTSKSTEYKLEPGADNEILLTPIKVSNSINSDDLNEEYCCSEGSEGEESDKNVPDVLELPKTRRLTRSCSSVKSSLTELVTKRRGRPAKKKQIGTTKISNRKMHEIDEKIAKHMELICEICEAVEDTFLHLCKHMREKHQKSGYVVCCNKKFRKRSFLTDHIDKHLNPDKFKCEECDKTFSNKQCLRNHELLKHQPEEVMTYKCDHCPKKFAKSYLLDQHRVTHEERSLPCDKCERRFPNASLLSTHIKMVHTNYGSTMCDICAKVIRGRAAFERHQLEHAGISIPKQQCPLCGSWHKDKYALQRHIGRHNISKKEYICNICGKVAPNRNALVSHQRYVHTSERKHKCSICGKAFKKPVALKEHMAIHTGEVLYKCPHCPKTFNSNANKHSHRKKAHPKEWETTRQMRQEQRRTEDGTVKPIEEVTTTSDDVTKMNEKSHTVATSHSDNDDDGNMKNENNTSLRCGESIDFALS